jgi:CheY-like chemotaxis protein
VIADIVMPEKDGIETVKEALAIDPGAVIFTMTGRDGDFQEVAMRLGAKSGNRNSAVPGEMIGSVLPRHVEAPTPPMTRDGRKTVQLRPSILELSSTANPACVVLASEQLYALSKPFGPELLEPRGGACLEDSSMCIKFG